MIKIGHSYDIHRLVADRDLILGGVKIEHDMGLHGHSDADVLAHAITESIIGALGLGDIGTFFPDNDPKYSGIDSMILLSEINQEMLKRNFSINNIDSIIYAEAPKILPHVSKMKQRIAEVLDIDESMINIKATTGEKVGPIGTKQAIGAESVVLITND